MIAVGAPIFVARWFVLYPVWVIAGWSGVGKAVPPDMGRLFRITFFGSLVVMLGTLALFELWARGGVNSHELTGRISLGFGLAAARLVTDNWEHRDAPSTTGWCAGPDGRRLDPLEVPPFQCPREGSCELLHFTPET